MAGQVAHKDAGSGHDEKDGNGRRGERGEGGGGGEWEVRMERADQIDKKTSRGFPLQPTSGPLHLTADGGYETGGDVPWWQKPLRSHSDAHGGWQRRWYECTERPAEKERENPYGAGAHPTSPAACRSTAVVGRDDAAPTRVRRGSARPPPRPPSRQARHNRIERRPPVPPARPCAPPVSRVAPPPPSPSSDPLGAVAVPPGRPPPSLPTRAHPARPPTLRATAAPETCTVGARAGVAARLERNPEHN